MSFQASAAVISTHRVRSLWA